MGPFMESSCGVYRQQDTMQEGARATALLRGRVADLRLEFGLSLAEIPQKQHILGRDGAVGL